MKNNNLLLPAINAAISAGKRIMEVYAGDFKVDFKEDASPLTAADQKSNQEIMDFLLPFGIPIISEENKQLPFEERKKWELCWLVDPLDGTKEFIKKNGEFTVNIALIEKGFPIMGVVYLPVQQILYFANEQIGSFKTQINKNLVEELETLIQSSKKLNGKCNSTVYKIVASRSHPSPATEEFIHQKEKIYGKIELVSKGSSIKLCLIAEGSTHVYPRLAPTMEWDTAAAHAVAKFAGCKVYDYETGQELHYNKPDLLNPFFVVEGE
ncbi:MAG: 3'(2'),5'-bisphosphate nucleotidase CysQ [Weeksellaceae bacterium]